MICKKCGAETGNSSSMCALCSAGAPASYLARPAVYPGNAALTGVQEAPSSPAAPTPTPPQSNTPQPQESVPKPVVKEKAPRPQRENSGTGETNVFAILGLIFAFFYPPVGLVLSFIGVRESRKTDDEKSFKTAIYGVMASLLMILLIIVILDAIFTNVLLRF